MKKYLLLLFLTIICVTTAYSQEDYLRKGNQCYTAGKYSDAIDNYAATLALMKNKGVKESSMEYSAVQKKVLHAKQCIELWTAADNSYKRAQTVNDYKSCKSLYQKVLSYNKSDYSAAKKIQECDEQIEQINNRERDDNLWREVTRINTKNSYQNYLANFPKGIHAKDADKNIKTMDEEDLWRKTMQSGTEDAYNEYLNSSKLKLYISQAEQELGKIKDNQLWNAISGSTNIQDFYIYLNNSKNLYKQHQDEANAKVYTLLAQEASESGNIDQVVENLDKAIALGVKLDDQTFDTYQAAKEQQDYNNLKKEPNLINTGNFVKSYPNSRFYGEVSDMYGKLLSDSFTTKSTLSDFDNALSYAQGKSAREYINNKISYIKKQQKQYASDLRQRQMGYSSWWDGRVKLGLGIEYEVMESDVISPLLNLNFGRHTDLFNASIGVQYSYLTDWDLNFASDQSSDLIWVSDPTFKMQQLNFPLLLKFNLFGNSNTKFFVSFGASFNCNLSAKYCFTNDDMESVEVDNDKFINKTNISGIAQLGIGGKYCDFSIYYKHHITSPLNKDYINTSGETFLTDKLDEKGRIGVSLKFYIPL